MEMWFDRTKSVTQSKVSICIPSYNYGRFLPQAIESILSQTYPLIETIIVDDGSTDESLDIAQRYASKHPERVKVFCHPGGHNLGISATINLAFQKSSGEYWSVMGADDLLHPQKTAQQVALLENHKEVDWVHSRARCIDAQGKMLPWLLGWHFNGGPRPIEKLIARNCIVASTVLARRECIKRTGLHQEHILYGDWEFWVRLTAHHSVNFIKQPLVQYRIHGDNISLGVEKEVDLERALDVMNSLRLNASQYGATLATPRTLALIDLQRARYLFHLGETEEAAEMLRSIFATYPSIQDEPRVFLRWLTDAYLADVNRCTFHSWVLAQLPANVKGPFRNQLRKSFRALALAAAALKNYQSGEFPKARQTAFQAQIADPHLLCDRQFLSMLARIMAGSRVMKRARQLKHRLQ